MISSCQVSRTGRTYTESSKIIVQADDTLIHQEKQPFDLFVHIPCIDSLCKTATEDQGGCQYYTTAADFVRCHLPTPCVSSHALTPSSMQKHAATKATTGRFRWYRADILYVETGPVSYQTYHTKGSVVYAPDKHHECSRVDPDDRHAPFITHKMLTPGNASVRLAKGDVNAIWC